MKTNLFIIKTFKDLDLTLAPMTMLMSWGKPCSSLRPSRVDILREQETGKQSPLLKHDQFVV